MNGFKKKYSGDEKGLSPSSTTFPFDDRKGLSYFARLDCYTSRIGTVFTDWDSISTEVFDLDEKLFVDVQSKNIELPRFEFEINNRSNIPNKIVGVFRTSHEIEWNSYHITNLSINECCLDDKFMRLLGEQQAITDTIMRSPKKQVFFVYGVARAGKIRDVRSYSSNRGWRFNFMTRFLSLHGSTSTSVEQHSSSTTLDTIFGIAVLKLTIKKKGGLKAEKLTTDAHF